MEIQSRNLKNISLPKNAERKFFLIDRKYRWLIDFIGFIFFHFSFTRVKSQVQILYRPPSFFNCLTGPVAE